MNEKQSCSGVRSPKQRKEESPVRRGEGSSKVANGKRSQSKVAKIPLTQGKFAIVDAEDFDFLMQWKWHFNSSYAKRCVKAIGGGYRKEWMHRVINKTPDGFETDHINGNRLDNRKCNLRTATVNQNQHNQRKHIDNRSGYKGVAWHKRRDKWIARIILNKKSRHLGYFSTAEAAHKAYRIAAKELYGDFARMA